MRHRTALGTVRQRKDVSQSQLARLSGVSRETINRIEQGKRIPGVAIVSRLADALEVPIDELLADCKVSRPMAALVRGLRFGRKARDR